MGREHASTGGSDVPERLGDYLLERRLGSGGMGVVYLARTVAGRQVAVKVIRRDYAEDPGFRARFHREVAAARRVSGAFTAPVVDADPEGSPPWLATLYVPGGSLTDRIDHEGPLDARSAARVGAQLAEALQDIHRCGLVHRDLKPGNVLLAEDGVRVIDFGISRALAASRRLTESGAVLGSPPFMAPEQLTGDGEVTEAADVFALGAVVAFAATGRSPFESGEMPGSDPLAVAYRVVHERPRLDDVPEPLHDLVVRCLAKDPERRPTVAAVLRMAARADSDARTHGDARVDGEGATEGSSVLPPDATEPRQEPARTRAPSRPRARRRLAAWVAAALAVVVAAGVGVWLVTAPGEADGNATDGPTEDGRSETAAFRPWELDLQDLGVRDAATEDFRCTTAEAEDIGLLCTSGGGLTVVLDAATGKELWWHNGPRDAPLAPSAIHGGEEALVFAHSDKGVVALDASGDVVWEIDAPELTGSMATVRGSLVVQNGDSTLRFYRRDEPVPVGSWEAPGRYLTATVSSGTQVLVESRADETGADPQLMLLDAEGRELWAGPRRPPDEARGMLEPFGMDAEAVYFQEFDPDLPVVSALLRLDLQTDTWTRTELPSPADPRSVVADGVMYASDTGGRITAVDARSGEVLWTRATGVETASEPAVSEGRLYLSDVEGRLYEVDARDGEVLRRGEAHPGTPGPGSDAWPPAPAIVDGRAYVVTLGNTLYATELSALR
ncbi:serine/threonine-protein kinase [Streptomyces sp. B6B3]|uniref:serine/threonine-protein kinase n=1 Tax=Streptomyces sp. B6B3 TaxID=3153570 RepID=UPI00325D8F2B